MTKYPNTKVLRKAVPTVKTETGYVKSWDIDVVFTHTREDGTSWSRTYSDTIEDLDYLRKTPSQFTKEEIIGLMRTNLDNVFDSHYESFNSPPVEEKVSDFDINQLG